MSTVQFLNHSCVLVADKKTRILCDPWFLGDAFQNGWSLLFDDSHDINDLEYDFIWISHEHPDHFSIETLSFIKEPTKFLYQETSDKKVKKFLEKKGHKVIELKDSVPISINEIELTLFTCDGYDSSLLFKFTDGRTFLNINDARVDLGNELDKLKLAVDNPIDMAAVQFSYANWAGNRNDKIIPLHQQKLVDKKNIEISEHLNPKRLLLFASFVYYSHEENFFWNENVWFSHALDHQKNDGVDLILPLPNQIFNLNKDDRYDSELNSESLDFWLKKHDQISIKSFSDTSLDISELKEAYKIFYEELWTLNSKDLHISAKNKDFCLRLHLRDLNLKIKIGLFDQMFEKIYEKDTCDCDLSSETFKFLMKNKFARGTLSVNSRIEFSYETAHRFFIFFFMYYKNNLGNYYLNEGLPDSSLRSIEDTSVLKSIFKFNDEARTNYEKDMLLFK